MPKREVGVVEEVKMEVVREVVSQKKMERTRGELEVKEREQRQEAERRREEQEVREKERREEELKERVRRSGGKANVGEVFRAFEERGEREAVLMEVGWKFNRCNIVFFFIVIVITIIIMIIFIIITVLTLTCIPRFLPLWSRGLARRRRRCRGLARRGRGCRRRSRSSWKRSRWAGGHQEKLR